MLLAAAWFVSALIAFVSVRAMLLEGIDKPTPRMFTSASRWAMVGALAGPVTLAILVIILVIVYADRYIVRLWNWLEAKDAE